MMFCQWVVEWVCHILAPLVIVPPLVMVPPLEMVLWLMVEVFVEVFVKQLLVFLVVLLSVEDHLLCLIC